MSERMTSIRGRGPSGYPHAFQDYGRVDPEKMYDEIRRLAQRNLDRAKELLAMTREDFQVTTGRGVIVERGREEVPWPERDEWMKKNLKRRTLLTEEGTKIAHRPGRYVDPATGTVFILSGILGSFWCPSGGYGMSGWPQKWWNLVPEDEWIEQQKEQA